MAAPGSWPRLALPNGTGIAVMSAVNVTIGGTNSGAGNLVSGNKTVGIVIGDATSSGALIEGNFIGTDRSGLKAIGDGIGVDVLGPNATIGGTTAAARNVIGGCVDGIHLESPFQGTAPSRPLDHRDRNLLEEEARFCAGARRRR